MAIELGKKSFDDRPPSSLLFNVKYTRISAGVSLEGLAASSKVLFPIVLQCSFADDDEMLINWFFHLLSLKVLFFFLRFIICIQLSNLSNWYFNNWVIDNLMIIDLFNIFEEETNINRRRNTKYIKYRKLFCNFYMKVLFNK